MVFIVPIEGKLRWARLLIWGTDSSGVILWVRTGQQDFALLCILCVLEERQFEGFSLILKHVLRIQCSLGLPSATSGK